MTTENPISPPAKLFNWTRSRENIWWTEYKGRRWSINRSPITKQWEFFVDDQGGVIARGNLRTVKYAAEIWILRRVGVIDESTP